MGFIYFSRPNAYLARVIMVFLEKKKRSIEASGSRS